MLVDLPVDLIREYLLDFDCFLMHVNPYEALGKEFISNVNGFVPPGFLMMDHSPDID